MPFKRYNRKQKMAAMVIVIIALEEEKKKRRKNRRKSRVWTKNWLLQREKFSHINLLTNLRENNPEDYRNYLRMTQESFGMLLSHVRPHITKQDSCMRKAVSAEERLMATLRFLATGRSFEDMKITTGISAQSLGRIIPETCEAIIKVLQPQYLKFPTNSQEWKDLAKEFQDMWNFPNCGGAIDGKHVRIIPPANSGSYYYNYKGFFSIILMAIVNAKYEFIYLDIGKNGRNLDGGVIQRSAFLNRLKGGVLHLPSSSETVEGLNLVFIGDDAFALHEHLLKPYPLRNLTAQQKIFNYRLSRARRVVENAFGIMASRFRIFHTAMNAAVEKVDIIVECCCMLHNFLRCTTVSYMPTSAVDMEDITSGTIVPGDWRNDIADIMADSPDAGPQIVQREEIVEGSRPVSAVTRRRTKASNMTFEEMVDMVNILQKDYDCREHVYSNMNIRKDAILEKGQHVLHKRHGSERTKDQLRKRWSDLKLREESQLRKINKIIDKTSAFLRTSKDLQGFCEQLDLPHIELLDWYALYFPAEPWLPVSLNPSPKAQRQKSHRPDQDETLAIKPFPLKDSASIALVHTQIQQYFN
ncbi:uncharacterized protein LOC143934951 [Lithobates pipiens]